MKTSPSLKRSLLLAAFNARPQPLPDGVLRDSVRLLLRPRPSEAEITEAIQVLEQGGYLTGVTDELLETRSWSLTTQGELKALQLT